MELLLKKSKVKLLALFFSFTTNDTLEKTSVYLLQEIARKNQKD
jgi:hypothetical protein